MAIGAAASFAGMIWPFQRGATGIFLNLVFGMGGAVLVAFASFLWLPGPHESPARLAYAAIGALAVLGLAHLLWYSRGASRTKKTA
jgi:uncharacterized membrane protein YeaQ/YmgE (transglycosylase-associated protein family)